MDEAAALDAPEPPAEAGTRGTEDNPVRANTVPLPSGVSLGTSPEFAGRSFRESFRSRKNRKHVLGGIGAENTLLKAIALLHLSILNFSIMRAGRAGCVLGWALSFLASGDLTCLSGNEIGFGEGAEVSARGACAPQRNHIALAPMPQRCIKRTNSATLRTLIFCITWARWILIVCSTVPRS